MRPEAGWRGWSLPAVLSVLLVASCSGGAAKEAAKTGVGRAAHAAAEALAKLANSDEARLRTEMLSSGRPAQLKAVIERWPNSPEAKEAAAKLARAESLCADADAYAKDLRQAAEDLVEIADQRADAARKTGHLGDRLDAYEKLGKDLTALGRSLKNQGLDIREHAIKPGEDKLRTTFHDGFWALADLASDLGERLNRPAIESDDSYDQHGTRAVAAWVLAVKKTADRIRKDLEAALAACAAPAP